MNVVVWIMVMSGHGSTITTGPEFATKEKCEQAVMVIDQSGSDRLTFGSVRDSWCVRIEK